MPYPQQATAGKPILISFSGIDGAGKSTQIDLLRNHLLRAGLNVRLLGFWDDVAMLTGLRESASHNLFNSEKGVGSPDKPVNRRDKNVQTWYMTPVRYLICFLDNLSLWASVLRIRASRAEVIIFDRYLYDELANLPLSGSITRAFVCSLLSICPSPDIAYFLDANPDEARERKPEYPIEFLRRNREAYLNLAKLSKMTVIPPGSVEEVSARILLRAMQEVPATGPESAVAPHSESPRFT